MELPLIFVFLERLDPMVRMEEISGGMKKEKARTKALGIQKDRIVCLQFAVDTRTRMDPPLPKEFTGNAYVLSSISCTSGELERESMATIIEKIKEAKQAVTNDYYVGAYLEALEAPQGVLPPLPELTMVSDWTRTPYHKVDFGIGDAVYVSPLASPFQQVAYFMQSPIDGGGIDVRIGLLPKHVPAFSHYFLATRISLARLKFLGIAAQINLALPEKGHNRSR
ncbi:brassinosteroid-related acyltransferase 1-like [Elaeis guineensis]|uniref:brassinosteroid-related acyltransferase 1-like n=1 Tax=Elaeis guineensis var. tenera TaxID=51953 RepID=UPI003C6DB3B6